MPDSPTVENPVWFLQGAVVKDILDRSDDADTILYDEEFDLEWRECKVPISAFPFLQKYASLEDYARDQALEEDDAERNREKFRDVETWMREEGPSAALSESPPLCVLLSDGTLDVLDGMHRLGVAHFVFAVDEITILVAMKPEPVSVPAL